MLRRRLMMLQQTQSVWRTVVKTGTGVIVADDTTEGMPMDLEMQGWTEQDNTTGTQLINTNELEIGGLAGNNGNEFVAQTRIRTGFIPVKEGLRYRLYGYAPYKLANTHVFKEDKTARIGGFSDNDMIPAGGAYLRVSFQNTPGTDLSEDDVLALKSTVMCNEGSSVIPWEPYTGGKPSPSPEYPQEIRNSGKLNEETQRYEYILEVMTKNLIDIPDITTETPQTAIACNIMQDIFVSVQESPTVSKPLWRFQAVYKDGTLKYLNDQNEENWTFPATKENPIVKIIYRGTYITAGAYKNVQVEYGTSATGYVPHAEQTVTVTSDRPVSKWDRLECRDSVYGWKYKTMIGKLTGDEEWNMYNDAGTQVFRTTLDPFVMQDDGYMDSFLLADNRPMENNYCFARSFYYGEYTIAIRRDEANGIEEFKKFLKGNNVQYVFENIEEEFVPLPEEEQTQLKALFSYSPTTVISNNTDMFMQAEYKTKTESIILVKNEIVSGTINKDTGEDADFEPYLTYRCKTKGYIELKTGRYVLNADGALRANIVFYDESGKYIKSFDDNHHNLPISFDMDKTGKIRILFSNNDVQTEKLDPNGIKNIVLQKVGDL